MFSHTRLYCRSGLILSGLSHSRRTEIIFISEMDTFSHSTDSTDHPALLRFPRVSIQRLLGGLRPYLGRKAMPLGTLPILPKELTNLAARSKIDCKDIARMWPLGLNVALTNPLGVCTSNVHLVKVFTWDQRCTIAIPDATVFLTRSRLSFCLSSRHPHTHASHDPTTGDPFSVICKSAPTPSNS